MACACTSPPNQAGKAQRVRRAPSYQSGTVSRRAPFCASALEAQRVRPAPSYQSGTLSCRAPFCACDLERYRSLEFENFLLFRLDRLVQLLDVAVGQLLNLIQSAAVLVFADERVLEQLLHVFVPVPANIAQRHQMVLGQVVQLL